MNTNIKISQDAQKVIRSIISDIFERREFKECWFAPTHDPDYDHCDCANWVDCSGDCPIAKLRMLAHYPSSGDGGISSCAEDNRVAQAYFAQQTKSKI
jgi:hypothetical protein